MLKRTFGPKREELRRGWRNLHNEGPHDLMDITNYVLKLEIYYILE
jgi:hypothetical protein